MWRYLSNSISYLIVLTHFLVLICDKFELLPDTKFKRRRLFIFCISALATYFLFNNIDIFMNSLAFVKNYCIKQ